MSEDSVDEQAVVTALELIDWPQGELSITDITSIDAGVNEVYTVATGWDDPARVVCKFATFSDPIAFQAGATAAQLLDTWTALPVPTVYAIRPDPPHLPAFQVMELLPGDPLPSHPSPAAPGPARALGRVIRKLGAIPAEKTEGYGWMQPASDGRVEGQPGLDGVVEGEYANVFEVAPPVWVGIVRGATDSRTAHRDYTTGPVVSTRA